MAVRRRRTSRPAKRPEAIRVLKVTSEAQWQKLVAKLGERLLLIHFSAVSRTADELCHCCRFCKDWEAPLNVQPVMAGRS